MSRITDAAKKTFALEAEAVANLSNLLTEDFDRAVKDIIECAGRLIVTGMGKSGLIGRKIAATLASTGTSSFFLHPGEAYHGDLGMISRDDMVLAISNSGQTDEVLKLIPFLEDNGNKVIAMTGNPESTLAKHSHYHLNVWVKEEACPMSLAPTSSTTATLAMGDALAIALIEERGFKAEDFARFHPGGSLGRRLLTKVADVMRSDNLPCVPPTMRLSEVIMEISNARLGVAVIVEGSRIVGLVTDGDVRRAMQKHQNDFFDLTVDQIMTRTPKTILQTARVTEAEELMRANKIHSLLVVDTDGNLAGIVELYDLMAGSIATK